MEERLIVKQPVMDEWLVKKFAIMLAWILSYFAPITEMLIFVGLIVFIDTFTGVVVAQKEGVFSSKRLFSVVYKTIIYFSALTLSHLAENIFEIGHITKITAGYIGITELTSIDENSEKLTGKRLFSQILDKIKRK